jgi:predicted lipase
VTGHSLGGALAAIAAVHIFHEVLAGKDYKKLSLLTLGEPRVGDASFAKYIGDKVI